MKQFFCELFAYSHHCNQKLADVFLGHPDKTSEKAVQIFNHVLNAHRVWNNRIAPTHTTFGIWELHPAEDLKAIDLTNYEQSLQILDGRDLNDHIAYSTSKGQPFNNSVQDILFHVINHSTYHRGQIAAEFRAHGLEPIWTDYIFYKR